MATARSDASPPAGVDAYLMTQDVSGAVRGGVQDGFRGVSSVEKPTKPAPAEPVDESTGAEPIEGFGDLLEQDDTTVYQAINNLNLRQERLAINRLEQDTHWARVWAGFPFSRLEQNQDQSSFRAVLPPGVSSLTLAAVPNKAQDLCNKAVETLMADPPKPLPKPINDSEEAERAAEMAQRWLEIDGGEAGTNDNGLFFRSLDSATYRSTAYQEYWVDKDGGGYVPLQIKAHPLATNPANPLVAQDPATGAMMPTTDYILRYVTPEAPNPEDPEAPGVRQFTQNPADAEQVWQPKIQIDVIYREHVRVFPEDKDVHSADAYIRLGYCTLGQAKRRWKAVRDLSEADQVALLDWQPTRFLVLLPAALRSRWKLGLGADKEANQKGGSNDERMMFWYRWCRKSCADYPRGASIYVSGALGGFIMERETLSAEVTVPASALEGNAAAGKANATDLREMDLPIVQVRLIQDTIYRDPTGLPLIGRIAGSSEVKSQLVSGYATMTDRKLHPATFTPGKSPVAGFQVQNSRATGDHVPILSKDDIPTWEPQPDLPANFLNFVSYLDNQMDLAASSSAPAQGSNDQQEVSGVARQLAIRQSNISMSRFNQAHLEAYARHCRIKVQLAMAYFRAPQLIRYVGDDGAYKQEWWTGADFALVSDVGIQPGTGTMQSQQEKINAAFTATQMRFLNPGDAQDIVRNAIAASLGTPDDPSQQRVERQVAAWLQGPPEGWLEQKQQQVQMQQQAQAAMAPQMQAWQAAAQQAQAMGQPVPPQPQMPPVPPVWSPFAPLPTDTEPEVADLRRRRLRKLIDSAKFAAAPPLWQGEAIQAYNVARQAAAQAAQMAQPQPAQGKQPPKPQPGQKTPEPAPGQSKGEVTA
jgi:hypothetical protein